MKVFISWSGDLSHAMAQALADWMPNVIQAVKPFLSSEAIQKGARWFEQIGGQLEETHFGVLCLTRSNLNAPWILFEAGALSKQLEIARVAPAADRPQAIRPNPSAVSVQCGRRADKARDRKAAQGDERCARR